MFEKDDLKNKNDLKNNDLKNNFNQKKLIENGHEIRKKISTRCIFQLAHPPNW